MEETNRLVNAYRRRSVVARSLTAMLTFGVLAQPFAAKSQDPPPAVESPAGRSVNLTRQDKDKAAKEKAAQAQAAKDKAVKEQTAKEKAAPPKTDKTKAAEKTPAKSATPGQNVPLRPGRRPGTRAEGTTPMNQIPVVPPPGNGSIVIPAPQPAVPPSSTPFSFDFRGSEISNVLKLYAQMANLNVVMDSSLAGPVTIINPKPITLDEAFKVLQSVLEVRGFTAIQTGNVLKVLPFDRAVTGTPLVSSGRNEDGTPNTDARGQVMTQVIPLENVDAEALAKELDPLKSKGASLIGSPGTNSLILTDTATNIQRFLELVDALDKTSNNTELKVYPLRRADATAIADTINSIFKQITTRGRGAPPQPGQPPPQPGQLSQGRPAVIAVADTRTNSVLVVGSLDNQKQIAKDIIKRLDDDDANALDTYSRKLKYANATDVANLINSVLNNMRPAAGGGGGGNPSFQSRAFGGGGFDQFGGGGGGQTTNSTDPFGKVVADQRTNTLLITASTERRRKIDELIEQLDVDVPTESTTFVVPLKNAQAADVGEALAQAFSTNQNQNNGFGNFFFGGFGGGGNRNSGRRQRINRRFGNNNNNNNGRSVPPGPPNAPGQENTRAGGYNGQGGGSAIPQGIQGVMTPDGFVPNQNNDAQDNGSERPTRQFFDFFGGGRRRGPGQSGGPQFGRGSNGNYANLLQLYNNVFITPSPGGDSLIITTTPDNIKAISDIITALDVVQRQVLIEVIVAEVTLDQNEKLGSVLSGRFLNALGASNNGQARINLPGSGLPGNFDVNTGGAQFTIQGADYSALVQALTSDNKVRVLSTPRVFTSNNQEASIEIVQRIPFITGQDAGLFGGNSVGNRVDFQEVGFVLNVLPTITRQGLVTIDVGQEASNLLRFDNLNSGVSGGGVLRAPVTNVRFANTLVTVQDGETVAIGGLISESTGTNIVKVPILSEIPLIGQFFRSREKTRNKVELMIFMTPHVVNSVQEAREMTLKAGQSIIKDIPEIKKGEPNLDTKVPHPDRNGKLRLPDPKVPTPDTKPLPTKPN